MCDCGGFDEYSGNLNYQLKSSIYPQSYPQKALPEHGGCGILVLQEAKLSGDSAERVERTKVSCPGELRQVPDWIFRDPVLQEYYARFLPEFQSFDFCCR